MIEQDLNTETRVGKSVVKAAFWTVGMRTTISLLGMLSTVILARILIPSDFGIVAKAVLVSAVLENLTQFGLDNALIKDQNTTDDHYDTVWTIQILRGLFISAALLGLAYPSTFWLNEPELNWIMCGYALTALVQGFINVGVVDFRKHFRFHLEFQLHLYTKLAGFVTTVSIAVIWQTYWAFVAGVFISMLTTVVVSFHLSPYRPTLCLKEFRHLFHFSKWVIWLSLVNAVAHNAEKIILSRYSTTKNLGIYTISNEVAGLASTEVAMPVARALFPGLSKLRSDPREFQKLYVRALAVVLALTVPLALGLCALSEPLVKVLLGPQWIEAIPVLKILALLGIARVLIALSATVFVAFDRVDIPAKLAPFLVVIRLLILVGGFYIGDFHGMLWGIIIASYLQALLYLFVQRSLGMVVLSELYFYSWRTAVAGITMFAMLTLTEFQLDFEIISLAVNIIFGALVFAFSLLVIWWFSGKPDGPESLILDFAGERWQRTWQKFSN